MNQLVTTQQNETELSISSETKELIQSSIAESTLIRYQRLSKQIEGWLNGSMLTDALLAEYITELHTEGKSPSTIAQVVAAAKWLAKNHGVEIVCEITSKTLAGIRHEGKERQSGVLFRHIRRGDHVQSGRLTTVSARRIIQARAKAVGVEGFISGHSLRLGLRWSICRMQQAGGSRHRCLPIMPKRSWRNGERSQGSSMGRADRYGMKGNDRLTPS